MTLSTITGSQTIYDFFFLRKKIYTIYYQLLESEISLRIQVKIANHF